VSGNGHQAAAVMPGAMPHSERELREAFLRQIDQIPGGEKLRRCIQCGTCTGSCPVAYAMDLTPREVIARFRAGDVESILRSRTIWTCASCYMCTTRCPSGIKITDLLYALKRLSMDRGIHASRFPVHVLSESFVATVNMYGRNWETGLMERYWRKTTTPVFGMVNLLKQAPLFLRLWSHGRAALRPHRIKGLDGLQAIIRRAEQMERPVEREEVKRPTRTVGYESIGGGA
jgi:quinone-modifying oxidoreductase, subunit QmoC